MTPEQRFWQKVNKDTGTECWEWTASLSKKGYGQFGYKRKVVKAHRFSLLVLSMQVPIDIEGQVCHTCDNKKCVRPKHLYLGSNTTNQRDAVDRGTWSNGNVNKTHCKRNHEFTSENTRINPRGERVCRQCDRDAAAAYKKRKKEQHDRHLVHQ